MGVEGLQQRKRRGELGEWGYKQMRRRRVKGWRDYKKVTEREERVNIVKRLQPGRRRGYSPGGGGVTGLEGLQKGGRGSEVTYIKRR